MKKQLNKKELEKANGGLSNFAIAVYVAIYKGYLVEKGKDAAEQYLRRLDISDYSKKLIRMYASEKKQEK